MSHLTLVETAQKGTIEFAKNVIMGNLEQHGKKVNIWCATVGLDLDQVTFDALRELDAEYKINVETVHLGPKRIAAKLYRKAYT